MSVSVSRHAVPPVQRRRRALVRWLFVMATATSAVVVLGAEEGRAGPVPITTAQFDLGQDLYRIRCSGCHGLSGEGLIGPSLQTSVLPLESVINQVTNGAEGMPAYSGVLTPAEIDAVARFAIGLRPPEATTTTAAPTTTTTTISSTTTTTTTSTTTTAPPTTTTSTTTTTTTTTTTPPTSMTSTVSTTAAGSATSTTAPAEEVVSPPEAATSPSASTEPVGGGLVALLAIAGLGLVLGVGLALRRRHST